MASMASARNWKLAKADLLNGLRSWESWYLLGISDIRLRYKRSRFGQFWITLSMAIFIAGIGVVYGFLFKQPLEKYIPNLAANYVVWSLISGIILDSSGAFTQATVYLTQDALPRSIFPMRVVVRNLVLFAHNIVIIPIVFLIFQVNPGWVALLAIPGLVLVILASFLVTLLLAIICTRYRDMIQILQNVVQMAFFVTPVMWPAENATGSMFYVVIFNPFAAFLRIIADPLRGAWPPPIVYYMTFSCIAVLLVLTALVFPRFRARIVYWL